MFLVMKVYPNSSKQPSVSDKSFVAMKRMAVSNVLIVGVQGLGVEIGNVVS